MKDTSSLWKSQSKRTERFSTSIKRTCLTSSLFAALLGLSGACYAVEFGPNNMFKLYGFGEVTVTRANNQCVDN